jgi:hypothetical protein
MGFELFAREAASDVAQGDLVFVEQHVPDSLAVWKHSGRIARTPTKRLDNVSLACTGKSDLS